MYQAEFDFKQREIHIGTTQGFNPTGWNGEAWTGEPNDPKDWDGASNTLHSIYSTKNVSLTGLEPDMTYYVRVVDVDKTNQRSEPSDEVEITPTKYNGEEITDIVWDSLHPTLQLVQVTNRDPFIIPEEDGTYGLQILAGSREYKFYPSADAYVREASGAYRARNYGGEDKLIVRYHGGDFTDNYKTYIKPNFSVGSIPAGETITSAKLVIYAEGTKRAVTLREVLSDWEEYTIRGGHQPDLAASDMISQDILAPGFVEFNNASLLAWVSAVNSGAKTNYGFRIYSSNSENDKFLYIRSRESGDPICHPYLHVKTSTGTTTGLNIMVTPGTMFVRNQVVRLNDAVTITLTPASTNYIFADIDDNGLFINSVTSQLLVPAGSLMIGVVTTDSTGVTGTPDITRKSGRREGNISFESMGVYKESNGGARAGNVYIGDWQQISSGGTASWEHNFNSLDVEVIGHFATSENPSSFQNIVPAHRIDNTTNRGITVAVTNNTVVFKAPPAGAYNFVHYDAITHTDIASGYVRAIVKLLK